MKRRCAYLFLLSILCSCTGTMEFKDKRKVLTTMPSLSKSLTESLKEKCLENTFGQKNGLYSPIGSKLIDLYKNNDNGFNDLYATMNVVKEHLIVKDTFATAATTGNKDNGKFRKKVAAFEGNVEELNQSIRQYFQVDMEPISMSGVYYFSYLELKDAFKEVCGEKDGLPFNGIGSHNYVSYYRKGKYYENDDFVMAELSLSETTFRVLMPKEGKTVNPESIFTQEMKPGFLDVRIPKFEIVTNSIKQKDDGTGETQINTFRFNKEGIYGTSFTYSAPTSDGTKPEVDFTFTFHRTFFFVSLSEEVPLFYGQLAELK